MHAITRQHRRWYNSLWPSGVTNSQKELIPFIPEKQEIKVNICNHTELKREELRPDEYDRVSRYKSLGTDKDTPSSSKQMPFGLSCNTQMKNLFFLRYYFNSQKKD